MLSHNLLLAGDDSYNIQRSLRFRSSASAYLNRTPASAGNRRTFTWSGWVKLGLIDLNYRSLFANGNAVDSMVFWNDNTFALTNFNGTSYLVRTTQVFRDPSAWYHLVIAFDTTQATASNRIKIYVNGAQVTNFATSTYPSQNYDTGYNTATIQYIAYNEYNRFEGYLAELNWIDGQALTPSSFGETDTITGVWKPKRYTGTYGTNGFYFKFTDTSSTAALGTDFSGNSNTWTVNNISLTAGTTYDSMTDVPTLTSATQANYCVMNPLTTGSFTTLSAANLNTLGNTSSNNGNSRSTFAMQTGKWYFETTLTANALSTYPQLGIMTTADGNRPNNGYPQAGYAGSSVNPSQSVIYMANGQKQISDTASSYGSSFTNGDVIGIAIDSDNGAIYFAKNGTWQNSGVPTSGSSKTGAALTWTGGTVEHLFSIADYNGTATATNFGQRPFSYTPPTGFVALNTFNLPNSTIVAGNKQMDATLYTGTGSALTVTNSGSIQPDFVWIKKRNSSTFGSHQLVDSVRGTSAYLFSDSTNAETTATDRLTSFNTNGFSLSTASQVNGNTDTFVGWQWKAGGTAVTNTAGSITSQVSANTTSGFSVVTYTGNGSSGTVGHGLGVTPSMIIVKSRSTAQRWTVFHTSISNAYIYLNETFAAETGNANLRFGNNTVVVQPTSTVFSIGNSVDVNQNTTTYVAYCFAPIAGYSAFGSYTGNGSTDGTFVYLGFRPKFILFKRTDSTGNWVIFDTSRSTSNQVSKYLIANSSGAEGDDGTVSGSWQADFLSNGFKLRATGEATVNPSGGTIIYAAFAENPFKNSLAR